MNASQRTDIRRTNVRGALVLGALLAAIVALGITISVRIYTQLDSTASLQSALVASQRDLDAAVAAQLNEAIGLRGYLATGETLFKQSYTQLNGEYASELASFKNDTAALGIPELAEDATEMRAVHEAWRRQVAEPLIADPRAKNYLTRETLGKILVDELRDDTKNVQDLLDARVRDTQNELKRRINEALFGGLASVLVFGLVGILFVGSRQQMLAVIDRERSIVETLQGAFSTDLDEIPGSRVGTAYLSADADAAVGGDLFDVRRLDGSRGLIVVADVSGKGIGAAVNTAFVKYSLRMLARTCDDPGTILAQFNDVFLDTVRDPNLFVVAFVGVLDPRARRLVYASAGHGGSFVRRPGGVEQLPPTGPIVGLDPGTTFQTRSLRLDPGDLLLVATDGLTEARDLEGELLDDAGAIALLRVAPSDPQTCADSLVQSIRARGGNKVADDLALLVIAIDPDVD